MEDYRDSDYERSWFGVTSWEGIKTVTTNLGTMLDNVLSHHKHNQPARLVRMARREKDSCQNFLFVFVLRRRERRQASGKLNLVLTKFI